MGSGKTDFRNLTELVWKLERKESRITIKALQPATAAVAKL